jgi:hypothetical protein
MGEAKEGRKSLVMEVCKWEMLLLGRGISARFDAKL